MKCIKILVIVFLSSVNFVAQNTIKGEVLYKYELNEEKIAKTKHQAVLNNFKKNLKQSSEKIRYRLLFNNKESSYKLIENLTSENDKFLNYAILITGGSEEFYLNKENNKRLKSFEFIGEKFIIEGKINDKWVLTQETKMIGKYICYRAVLDQASNQQKAKLKLPKIEAWYCPKIPLMFGPKGYGNLPGLILELSVGPISYLATRIELNPVEKIAIIKPNKGKLVTEEEFDDILIKIDKQRSR